MKNWENNGMKKMGLVTPLLLLDTATFMKVCINSLGPTDAYMRQ